jgi:hypothetical protein
MAVETYPHCSFTPLEELRPSNGVYGYNIRLFLKLGNRKLQEVIIASPTALHIEAKGKLS